MVKLAFFLFLISGVSLLGLLILCLVAILRPTRSSEAGVYSAAYTSLSCISHLLQTNSETAAPLVVLLYAKEKNSQTHEQAQHGGREKYPRSREDYERDTNNKTIKSTLASSSCN